MLGQGLHHKQIGCELGVSDATVRAHMTAILRKRVASNRTELVLVAGRLALEQGAMKLQPDELEQSPPSGSMDPPAVRTAPRFRTVTPGRARVHDRHGDR